MQDKTLPISSLDRKKYLDRPRIAPIRPPAQLDYRALFEQTGDCVFLIGFDLRYLAVNSQAARLLGYREEELVGRPVQEVMALEAADGSTPLVSTPPGLYERILRRKDGSTFPVEISTSIVYNGRGLPSYIQSIARDISERKLAEQSLDQHDRILEAINEAAVRLLRASDAETKVPEVLAMVGEATGVVKCALFRLDEAALGRPDLPFDFQWSQPGFDAIDLHSVLAFLNVDRREYQQEVFLDARTLAERITWNASISIAYIPMVDADTTWGFLGLFDASHSYEWTVPAMESIRTAVTIIAAALQRHSYEQQLRESEVRNRNLLNALPDLVIRIDGAGRVLDYSARLDHPLHRKRETVLGKTLPEIWGQAETESFMPDLLRMKPGDRVEATFRHADLAQVFELRVEALSLKEKLVLIRDISDRARLDQLKSDFINRASHELRTPLTTAILMVDLIQDGGHPGELEEYWRVLRRELNRQKNLVDRLLMAGRLESGTVRIDPVAMDLIPTLKESWQAVKPGAQKKRIDAELLLPKGKVRVMGDAGALEQVFINLLNNAIKFSPEGSTLAVRVECEADGVRVAITDRGIGIPTEDLPNLFERFFRARNVTVAEIPGSGVGLYIVKSIVEELGGSIRVESAVGAGTTFTVRLQKAG